MSEPKPFPMSVVGSVITIEIPAMEKVQLHHELFPPVATKPLFLKALFSPVTFNVGDIELFQPSGGYWVVTPEHDAKKFQILTPQAMLGFVNVALTSGWKVKGYEPNQYPLKNECN
jgi:hypothetical protein